MKRKNAKSFFKPLRLHQFPCIDEFNLIRELLKSRYGIERFYLGGKEIQGQLSGDVAIVCVVENKSPSMEICKAKGKLPKYFRYNFNGKKKRFLTDVVECQGVLVKQRAVINPGDKVQNSNAAIEGTLGLMGRLPAEGLVITTAGHVINDMQRRVGGADKLSLADISSDTSIPCSIVKCVENGELDYAILKPHLTDEHKDVVFNDYGLTETYLHPQQSDVGSKLFVLAGAQIVETQFKGVQKSEIDIDGDRFCDLILTGPVTRGGDSGAALIDASYRVWGLLIGMWGNSFSLFMPIRHLVEREGFTLYSGNN